MNSAGVIGRGQEKTTRKITLIAMVLAAVPGHAYVGSLPAAIAMSTGLSIVGQGKPVVAPGCENTQPSRGDVLDLLSRVRGDYETQLAFVIANYGTPPGIVTL